MVMEVVRVVKRRKASHDLGVPRRCRLHGVGAHASRLHSIVVLMGGKDAHGASAADAVPN